MKKLYLLSLLLGLPLLLHASVTVRGVVTQASDGEPVIDKKQVMPGRGCYLCKNEKCIETAIKKRAFSRALKTEITNEALGRCFNDR